MRQVTGLLALWLAACGGAPPPPPPPAEDLAWLVGTWEDVSDEVRLVEAWRALPNGALLGSGHLRSGKVLVFAEAISIVDTPTGRAYVAWPVDQEPVRFPEIQRGPGMVVFENTAHDFPKRLEYRRAEDGTLAVKATGDGKDGPREEAWTLEPAAP